MELNTNRANLLDPNTVVDEDTCLTAGEVNDVMREIFQETLHERWRRRTKAKAYAGLVLLTASTGLLLLAKVSLAGYPQVGAHCLSGLMSMLALWLLLSPWKTGYNQKPFVIMGAVACLFGSLSSALGLTGVVPEGPAATVMGFSYILQLLCVWTAIFLAVTSAIRAIRASGISAQQLLDDEGPWEDWWR